MKEEREIEWWPIGHEYYDEACRLLERINLTDEELHGIVYWASAPAFAFGAGSPFTDRSATLGYDPTARVIDYDKLYHELQRRAGV